MVQEGLFLSPNCSFLQKTAGFRRFLLPGDSCGARMRPLVSPRWLLFFPSLLGSIAYPASVPAWARPVESCVAFCRPFFERRLLLPLSEPPRPPSKGAQKRPRAGGLSARQFARTGAGADMNVDAMSPRMAPRHAESVRHVSRRALTRACATGASVATRRSHPRGMTTHAESNSKLSRPGNGRVGPVIYVLSGF